MKRTNKKGFTLVELVIVIAIIAILAAVLIPTFSGVVKRANESKALQEARNFKTMIMANTVAGGTVKTNDSKTYSLTLGETGLVVSKSGEGNNLAAETIVWNLLGTDANDFKNAKIGMDVTGDLNGAGPWTVTAFYFQPSNNSNWIKIDLVNNGIELASSAPAASCTFDGNPAA